MVMFTPPPGPFIDPDRMRVNPVTPFTYRDGLTYLEVLETLRARDVELVEMINAGLKDAAQALNDAIAGMWDDLEGPLAKLAKYDLTIAKELENVRESVDLRFATLEAELLQRIADAITAAMDPDVFNWHEGQITKLSRNIFDDDNHYANFGLTAGDYTRKGFTVQELDDIGHSVEELAYRGVFYGERFNPRLMHNDAVGTQSSIRSQIATAAETGLTGTVSLNVAANNLTFNVSDAKERIVS